MKVIAVANRKGGVGKTTLSLALATKLSESDRVLLIDLDSQANATEGLNIRKAPAIGLWLDYDQVPKLVQVTDGLYVMPGHVKTERVNVSLAQEGDIAAIHRGLEIFQFEYVIIDCPPSLSILARSAIYAADFVLCPTVPEYWSVAGVRQIIITIAQIRRRFERPVNLLGIQPNKYDRRTKEHKTNLTNMVRAWGVYTQHNGRVWPPLRQSIAVAAAASRGVPIWGVLRGRVLHEWEQVVERVRAACG